MYGKIACCFAFVWLVACNSGDDLSGPPAVAEQGGQGGGGAGSSGVAQGGNAGASAGNLAGGSGPEKLCVPGQSIACTGPSGCKGGQACKDDGSGFETCNCGGECTPGDSIACIGPDGCSGTQICYGDGPSWSPCMGCPDTGGAAGSGAAGNAGDAGGGGEAGNSGEGGNGDGGVGGANTAGAGQAGAGAGGSDAGGAGSGGASAGGNAGGAGGDGGMQGGAGQGGAGGVPLVCSACPDEREAPLWEEATEENLGMFKAKFCIEGVKPDSSPPECWLTIDTDKANLTATVTDGAVTFEGTLPVWLPASHHDVYLGDFTGIGQVRPVVSASLGQGQGGACDALNPTNVQISWTGPLLTDEANPVFGCTPMGASTAFQMTLPEGDFHLCGTCNVPVVCGVWSGLKGGFDKRIRARIAEITRATLDEMATKQQCAQPAP